MPVETVSLPEESALTSLRSRGDFLDCYRVASNSDCTAETAALRAFANPPSWVASLMRLRNMLVKPFGLKTGQASTGYTPPKRLEVGGKLGPFTVHTITPTEVIMGDNDSHLDFRISILKSNGYFHLATWVKPHNLLGRSYLRIIVPFHVAISRTFTRRLVRHAPDHKEVSQT